MAETTKYLRWLDELTSDDVPIVGGKNASLGEMIQSLQQEGVHVPGGFATTADAYRQSRCGASLVAAAGPGHRTGADGIHHQ